MDLTWNEKVVATKDLKPYERNPRKISAGEMAELFRKNRNARINRGEL